MKKWFEYSKYNWSEKDHCWYRYLQINIPLGKILTYQERNKK